MKLDRFGTPITENAWVAFPVIHRLAVGKVITVRHSMVHVKYVTLANNTITNDVPMEDLVVLSDQQAIYYSLHN